MVSPSRIARKARREHERQQGILKNKHKAQSARQLSRDCGANKKTSLDTHVVGCGQSTIVSLVAPKPIYGMRTGSLRRKTKRDLKNKLFKGVVLVEPRETALARAASEVDSYLNEDRLVLWTDGSGSDFSDCGIGIAYHSSKYVWDDLSWRIRGQISTYLLEMYAIVRALEIGWDMCRNQGAERKPSKIVIYSDCSGALGIFNEFRNSPKRLKKLPNAEQLIVPGIIASEALSVLEVEVELRHVPGHSGVEGNVRADRAAKIGRKKSIGKGKLIVARVVGSRA
ncbi:uncharacterized protein EAF01_009799 [Botrytis porri]|uniref:RNase H type-1 domain-containing protein n=1 Tax=Botrytis porri TaxID=87229 RepID=A0A4Z1KPP2_9HELO|nr:uncharacterized protein EAF01_009799 [Botrytis porri]KAF7894348.1 hypothetical protein EAF01_009799 [Botrytis porri]TGO83235.1 hypothetical protein BPOR_0679g00080 [Botrytis porri]